MGQKTCCVPKVTNLYAEIGYLMLTAMSCLAGECVFYKLKHNAKRRPYEIEF